MNENHDQIEFILIPYKRNMVTEKDIAKCHSIRITGKFKHIFPNELTTFIVNANTITDSDLKTFN